jgi:hypothetical protein
MVARSRLMYQDGAPAGLVWGTVGGPTVEAVLSSGESEGVRRGSMSAGACPREAGSVR